MLRRFLVALSFLTIIPVRFRADVTGRQMLDSTLFFPVVGVLLGFFAIVVEHVSGYLFGTEISVLLMLFALVLVTGALHLDGLSDTFDAMASKADRERRLEIMREGSSGPAGNAAVLFTLALKYLALMSASNLTGFMFYASVLFMPAMGRWAMLAGMFTGRKARPDGLGTTFIGRTGPLRFAVSTAVLLLLMLAPALADRSSAPEGWWLFVIISIAAVFALVLLAGAVSNRRFGGFSGDVLGAIGEITEAMFPLMVITWSRLYTL